MTERFAVRLRHKMRKPYFLRTLLPIFLLLTLASGPPLPDDEKPGFSMPCDQVLKLGLEKFTKAYGDRMQDFSTAGQKQAFEYYVKCKRPANDELVTKLLQPTNSLGVYEA